MSTWRLPPESRASSARARDDTGPSSARCSRAPSSSRDSGRRSSRTRWPSRWSPVRRADGFASRADRPDEEHGAGDDQRHQHGHRRVVEQVEVVDEQHQAVVAGQPAELGACRVEQGGALVVADAEVVDERRRQEVGEGAERDRLGGGMTDGPLDVAPGALGEPQRLLGEAGLADAGGPVEDDAPADPRRGSDGRAPRAEPPARSAATVRSSPLVGGVAPPLPRHPQHRVDATPRQVGDRDTVLAVVNPAKLKEFMRAVPLFAGLLPSELERIALVMNPVETPAGETVCQEGDPGHEFYLLADGEAAVERNGQVIAKLHAGDHFGELALLDRGPRSATVRAVSDVRLYVLHERSFAAVLNEVPALAQKLLAALASRLREAESPPPLA